VDDLLVVDPEDRATSDEAMKSSWLNRRFGATVRNPKAEEMDLAKDSLLRYAGYSKLRQLALMGSYTVPSIVSATNRVSFHFSLFVSFINIYMIVIAHKSTSSEIGMLRKIFQQFDTDGVGHLNYEQFRGAIADPELMETDYRRIFDAVVRKLSWHHIDTVPLDAAAESVFFTLVLLQDLDGTGKIRYTEFLAATIEANGSVSEVRLAEAFDRLDSDDSGYISVENLLEILGDGFAKEDVEAIIQEAATDNDGQISYAEFLALWERKHLDDEDGLDALGHDVKVVNVVKKNDFESERSTAISLLSSDGDDAEVHFSSRNDPLARAHFIQGKILSERNVILQDKRRRNVAFNVNAIDIPNVD
jgi:calcium-dependent protein kinase